MMLRLMFVLVGLFVFDTHIGRGQEARNSAPCRQPEARQFDFWIGEWNAEWELGGKSGKGTNVVRSILDQCVIEENFDGTPSMPLRGMSLSTFTRAGKWQQTWVDNQGGYLDFIGGYGDGQMVLQRKAIMNGKALDQRMVWYNITKDKFDWNWESSDDGGKTWTVVWKINYTRKK